MYDLPLTMTRKHDNYMLCNLKLAWQKKERKMKIYCTAFVIVMAALSIVNQSQAKLMSADDPWNISQGASVITNSAVHSASAITNMFGGSGGYAEATNTLFTDSHQAGYVHWVEWQTISPITLTGFNLVASHDGGSRDANERGFSQFTLYAWVNGDWQTLYNYCPSNPYGGGVNYTGANVLELYADVTPTLAQKYRAEFVQYGDRTASAKGPRVWELDGYCNPTVPEPMSIILAALGLSSLAALRRRRA